MPLSRASVPEFAYADNPYIDKNLNSLQPIRPISVMARRVGVVDDHSRAIPEQLLGVLYEQKQSGSKFDILK